MLFRKVVCLLFFFACTSCYGDGPQPTQADNPKQATQPVIVVYLPDYAIGRLDAGKLFASPITDLIYFGMSVPLQEDALTYRPNKKHLAVLEQIQKRSGCRLLLCVGGWQRSDGFTHIATNPQRRKAFIDFLFGICKEHGFDGIDYDWEHPKDEQEIAAYSLLIEETAQRFDKSGYLVTVAQAPWQNLSKRAYAAADRIHLMCYDQAYPHATMQHAKREVKQLIDWECPPDKIALGIPFYGRNKDGQAQAYRDVAQSDADPASPNQIQGYAINSPELVADKTRWACEQGLAGVMIWELTQDNSEQDLLRAIERTVREMDDPDADAH